MKVKKIIILLMLFLIISSGCSVIQQEDINKPLKNKEEQLEKGYNLTAEKEEEKEAEEDCKRIMLNILDIYLKADKGTASNIAISDETMQQMQQVIKDTNCPVTSMEIYSYMENYKYADDFLNNCINGLADTIIMYEIHSDGGIERDKYIFDEENMYLLSTGAIWNEKNEPVITYNSYNRIEEWEYTDKGWFCYKICVPEPPEVTETINGNCMVRVKPLKDEYRRISETCLLPLGYLGNNILCSNWDREHMAELDYNGIYEYLYKIKYQEETYNQEYPMGILKDDFENLIMEFLPVTKEDIRKYSVFNEEKQTYAWARIGCLNYSPTLFGTSVPEVTDIRENQDGTVTLTVDAVCEMCLSDAAITHELTLRFSEDGSFSYIGNKILNDGIKDIPEYQYRIRETFN